MHINYGYKQVILVLTGILAIILISLQWPGVLPRSVSKIMVEVGCETGYNGRDYKREINVIIFLGGLQLCYFGF